MKRALVVVCYQNDHVTGKMGSKASKTIEKTIVSKIEEALDFNDDIFFVMDSYEEGFFKTSEGKKYPAKHCLRGTKGAELYGKVNDFASNGHMLMKKTYGSDALYGSLRGFDEIEFCGVDTHTSVLANVIIAKTVNPTANIIVNKKAVASKDSELADQALLIMETMGVQVQ